MKGSIKHALMFLPLLVVLILQSGCCTYSMWNDGTFDASREPAQDPRLKLFQAKQDDDYLVVYKEYSERKESIRLRAYWLNENEDRIAAQQKPKFVDAHIAADLARVRVFNFSPTNDILRNQSFAVYGVNKQSFVLFSGATVLGSHNLPIYDDGVGKIERIAMTPLTATADVVITAGVVAIVAGVSYASNYPCYDH